MERTETTSVAAETRLYRWYDADGTLLYVGITNRSLARANEHLTKAPWARWAVRCVIDPVGFASRKDAERRERECIASEGPIFNQRDADGWYDRASDYLLRRGSDVPAIFGSVVPKPRGSMFEGWSDDRFERHLSSTFRDPEAMAALDASQERSLLLEDLEERREEAGLTVADMARMLRVDDDVVPTLSPDDGRAGGNGASISLLMRYARALGLKLTFKLEEVTPLSEVAGPPKCPGPTGSDGCDIPAGWMGVCFMHNPFGLLAETDDDLAEALRSDDQIMDVYGAAKMAWVQDGSHDGRDHHPRRG